MERFNSFSSDSKDTRNPDHIVLTKRQVSMIMASLLLFCLFVFIVGFFLGKRTIIEDFSSKVSKETLHDQVDFLLTMQSLQSSQEDAYQSSASQSASAQATMDTQKNDIHQITLSQMPVTSEYTAQEKLDVVVAVPLPSSKDSIEQEGQQTPLYAQLIGFGTKKAAQAFVARLKKHGIPVVLKTMMSKTASGKQRTWYQAITPTYYSLPELNAYVAKIKQLEHIRSNDIKIVSVR